MVITIQDIITLAKAGEFDALRSIHGRSKIEGIENCDEQQLSTLRLCILHCSLYRDKSPAHLRSLLAMLDAIDRGNHPYDDIIANSTFEAEAAIARAQIESIVKK